MFLQPLNESTVEEETILAEQPVVALKEAYLEFVEGFDSIRHECVLGEYKAFTESDESLKVLAESAFTDKMKALAKAFFAKVKAIILSLLAKFKTKRTSFQKEISTDKDIQLEGISEELIALTIEYSEKASTDTPHSELSELGKKFDSLRESLNRKAFTIKASKLVELVDELENSLKNLAQQVPADDSSFSKPENMSAITDVEKAYNSVLAQYSYLIRKL